MPVVRGKLVTPSTRRVAYVTVLMGLVGVALAAFSFMQVAQNAVRCKSLYLAYDQNNKRALCFLLPLNLHHHFGAS